MIKLNIKKKKLQALKRVVKLVCRIISFFRFNPVVKFPDRDVNKLYIVDTEKEKIYGVDFEFKRITTTLAVILGMGVHRFMNNQQSRMTFNEVSYYLPVYLITASFITILIARILFIKYSNRFTLDEYFKKYRGLKIVKEMEKRDVLKKVKKMTIIHVMLSLFFLIWFLSDLSLYMMNPNFTSYFQINFSFLVLVCLVSNIRGLITVSEMGYEVKY